MADRAADIEVLVVGGGFAGLAAARELERAGREVLLVDAADGLGGVARTDRMGAYRIERGPNTFRVPARLAQFLRDHELGNALLRASPASRDRYLFRDGALVPVPLGPIALARSSLLSGRAKRRLLREPFVVPGDGSSETVAEFVSRRMGPEVLSGLVGPFLTGVYAGDEERLGAASVFPSLVELEREYGSVVWGALRRALSRRAERGLPGTWSGVEGTGDFASRLAAGLDHEPRRETRAESARFEHDVWHVRVSGAGGEEELHARHLVVATPSREAAELLRSVDEDFSGELGSLEYAPIACVSFGAGPDAVSRPIRGFGFLVPRESGLGLLGCLFMSQLFPGRAPAGQELLHCMLGGVRAPELLDLSDDELREHTRRDLDRTLGLRGELEQLGVWRWPRAVAQPGVEHPARVKALRARLARQRGLHLAGSYLSGVSVPDTIASGTAAAAEIIGAS